MSQQDHLNNFLNSLAEDISGFIGASVVDLGTGMSLASVARVANFDLDVAAAYNCEMVKAKRKTIQALGIDSHLQDMLLTWCGCSITTCSCTSLSSPHSPTWLCCGPR